LKGELERLAARPAMHVWLDRVRERKQAAERRIPARQIVKSRDADRR